MFPQCLFVLLLVRAAVPSVIIESPQPVQVMKGSPATLKCRTSSSSPTLEITWYKDGSQFLLDQKVGRCLLLPDGSLFFLTTSAEDTGDYYCAVTGRKLVVRSKSARLSVLGHGQKDQEEVSEEDLDEQSPTLDIFLPSKVLPPSNISAQLLLDGTAVVEWTLSAEATGYLVTVLANDIPVTNISVDSSVNTVKLHNLSPAHEYTVCVASVAGDSLSAFSDVHKLHLNSPLAVQTRTYHNDIPTEIWVIAFLVVIMMTLIIILVVTIIVIRTRRVAGMTAGDRIEYVQAMNTDKM